MSSFHLGHVHSGVDLRGCGILAEAQSSAAFPVSDGRYDQAGNRCRGPLDASSAAFRRAAVAAWSTSPVSAESRTRNRLRACRARSNRGERPLRPDRAEEGGPVDVNVRDEVVRFIQAALAVRDARRVLLLVEPGEPRFLGGATPRLAHTKRTSSVGWPRGGRVCLRRSLHDPRCAVPLLPNRSWGSLQPHRQATKPMPGVTLPPGAVSKNRLILTHPGPTECLQTAKPLRAGWVPAKLSSDQ